MGTYCIAQGALFGLLWWPEGEGNPEEGIYICTADSLCSTAEINTTLQSNHTPIKILEKVTS